MSNTLSTASKAPEATKEQVKEPVQIQETEQVEQAAKSAKKGNSSWKPRNAALGLTSDPKEFTERDVRADPARIAQMIEQGWELMSALNDSSKKFSGQGGERIIDGKPLDSVIGGVDTVRMRLSIAGAKERRDHYENLARSRVKGLKTQARADVGDTMKGDLQVTTEPVKNIIQD